MCVIRTTLKILTKNLIKSDIQKYLLKTKDEKLEGKWLANTVW